jgi:2-methylcitrate dehydratase PrpD
LTLHSFAEHLLCAAVPRDVINLHVADALAAFCIGARTGEGKALSAFYRARVDRAGLVAAAAAIARLSESDDIHLASCVTPGAVVIPIALAFADRGSADDFDRAVSAAYAAGLRLGIGIGGAEALAAGVWPTLLAAPLMAAVAVSCLRGHDRNQLVHAIALALAGANGRIGRPAGSSSGRWFLLAEAVLKGLRASEAAEQGFRGDVSLISKPWLAAQAGHDDVEMAALDAPAPSVAEVDFKPFPIARQGLNAIIAFQHLLQGGLDPDRIETIEVFVPKMHVPLLSRRASDDDRLSRLCDIGFQLGCAALAPGMLADAERTPRPDVPLAEFARRVSVRPSADLDAHLPNRWATKVVVVAGRDRLEETVIGTPLDHDAPNLAQRLGEKWRSLLAPEDFCALPSDVASGQPGILWQQIERRVSMSSETVPREKIEE